MLPMIPCASPGASALEVWPEPAVIPDSDAGGHTSGITIGRIGAPVAPRSLSPAPMKQNS